MEDSEGDEEEDENDDDEEECTSHDEQPSSCSSDTHPSVEGQYSCSQHSRQGSPEREPPGSSQEVPSPRGVWSSRRAASPGSRRALFSQRAWKAVPRAFSPSSESCSPSRSLSPRLELSPPVRSHSPRPETPLQGQHVSPSPERGPSPIGPLSPLRPPGCYRSSRARTPPSPLRLQHRAAGCLPWESPGTRDSPVQSVSELLTLVHVCKHVPFIRM